MYFYKKDVVYARYSDDIILFAKDEGSRNNYREIMLNMLNKFNLKINSTKEFCINPNEKWEFLGISYFSKSIDVSDIAIKKMKGKIRRKANALFRWKKRKNATDERAMKAMIRAFNDKFFDKYDDKSVNLTWSRWYFPVINVNIGLKIIDDYLQRYIRFISSGKHCKKNYKISYDKLKEMGYKSLVNEYYKHKKQKSIEKCDIEKEILIKPINSV
ncbi:MAG: hypothetical protein GX896_06050 [Clostridiales bacterium]|nr:hypothetical protein [Clostridiales bacterium]